MEKRRQTRLGEACGEGFYKLSQEVKVGDKKGGGLGRKCWEGRVEWMVWGRRRRRKRRNEEAQTQPLELNIEREGKVEGRMEVGCLRRQVPLTSQSQFPL